MPEISLNFYTFHNAWKDAYHSLNLWHEFQKDSSFFQALEQYKRMSPELVDSVINAERLLQERSGAYGPDPQSMPETERAIYEAVGTITAEIMNSLNESKTPLELHHKITFFKEWIYPIILALIFCYVSVIQSGQDSEKLAEEFRNSFSILERALNQSNDSIREKIFYKVLRPVWLSEEQKFHESRIGLLLPGQSVEVIDFDGKWVFISAYDVASKKNVSGWVLKKYLKRLPKAGSIIISL